MDITCTRPRLLLLFCRKSVVMRVVRLGSSKPFHIDCGTAVFFRLGSHLVVQLGFLRVDFYSMFILADQRICMRLQILGLSAVEIAFVLIMLEQLLLLLSFCTHGPGRVFVIPRYGLVFTGCRGVLSG